MPMLRSIESKLESLFEGVFGRAFRANVQPVELARKLVKEMDDHRNVSVSRSLRCSFARSSGVSPRSSESRSDAAKRASPPPSA